MARKERRMRVKAEKALRDFSSANGLTDTAWCKNYAIFAREMFRVQSRWHLWIMRAALFKLVYVGMELLLRAGAMRGWLKNLTFHATRKSLRSQVIFSSATGVTSKIDLSFHATDILLTVRADPYCTLGRVRPSIKFLHFLFALYRRCPSIN